MRNIQTILIVSVAVVSAAFSGMHSAFGTTGPLSASSVSETVKVIQHTLFPSSSHALEAASGSHVPSATALSPASTAAFQIKQSQSTRTMDKPNVALLSHTAPPDAVQVVTNPNILEVLVNKDYTLPPNYTPRDLVDPNVPYIFSGKSEKRLMRKPAAEALVQMFAAAKKDGIYLSGVSAYRAYATQKRVFDDYAKKDGYAAANRYSALPGESEHETGLAIDVSGSTGQYAVTDAFANTKEATWLAKHAYRFGFIIRYPKGKEAITGYKYEPWHLRYVGKEVAEVMTKKGMTLEEYLDKTPV